jgi:hypothetical protein
MSKENIPNMTKEEFIKNLEETEQKQIKDRIKFLELHGYIVTKKPE